jgi:septum formation inhibitor MinC
MDALDVVGFSKSLKENYNFPSDIIRQPTGQAKVTLTEKDLMRQEAELRESLMVWSSLRWGTDTLTKVMAKEDMTAEEKWEQVQIILTQQQELAPILEDKLVTMLGNTTLRRRDMTLSSVNAGLLSQENLLAIRGSSLTSPFLFQFPKEMVEKERDLKERRVLVGALVGSNRQPRSQPFQRQGQSASTSAGSSQAQTQQQQQSRPAATSAPAAATTATATPSTSSAQPQSGGWKGRGAFRGKGKGRGSFPRGKPRGSWNPNYKSKGRGQQQRR